LEEATKFGLRDVITPERAPTLREALRMALRPAAEGDRVKAA
jgi:hypothetical protein